MADDINEELRDEEPMEIGSGFVLRIIAIGVGLITVIVGIPYILMK